MPMSEIKVKLLADGRVKLTTVGEVAAEHHSEADDLLNKIHELTGGTREVEHLKETHAHLHEHSHGQVHHKH